VDLDTLPALDGHHPIPPEQATAFARDGHALVPGLASREEVDAFRDAIVVAARENNLETRPMAERPTYNRAFLQTANLWRVSPVVQRFVFSPRFARVAADLLGVEGVRLYHDQALLKEAGGGHTPWHQDQFYWPFRERLTITMWMALVDVPPNVGTMTFATGTHLMGALVDEPISDESEAAFADLVAARDLPTHTYGAVRAGDATFHAGWTLHRAGPNPTDDLRSVMTVIYVADGVLVAPPENPYQEFDRQVWLEGTQPGRPVGTGSSINPRLFPPE
jgi:ectoine hydroxylase-related dioxygenase (phytanoyl-CoA dioxygenase family)